MDPSINVAASKSGLMVACTIIRRKLIKEERKVKAKLGFLPIELTSGSFFIQLSPCLRDLDTKVNGLKDPAREAEGCYRIHFKRRTQRRYRRGLADPRDSALQHEKLRANSIDFMCLKGLTEESQRRNH